MIEMQAFYDKFDGVEIMNDKNKKYCMKRNFLK